MDGTPRVKEENGGKETFTFVNEQATFPGSLAAAKFNVLPVTSGRVEITFYVKDNKRDYINAQTEVIGKIKGRTRGKLQEFLFQGSHVRAAVLVYEVLKPLGGVHIFRTRLEWPVIWLAIDGIGAGTVAQGSAAPVPAAQVRCGLLAQHRVDVFFILR